MNDDKELVEVWRAEFESQFDDDLFARGTSGAYINHHRNSMWQGFLLAKRSQPIVVLPKITQRHSANYIDGIQDCKACLTAAGIKYTKGN